jgi:hypothetical protein
VCVAALERELHTEPESETRALYQGILRRNQRAGGEASRETARAGGASRRSRRRRPRARRATSLWPRKRRRGPGGELALSARRSTERSPARKSRRPPRRGGHRQEPAGGGDPGDRSGPRLPAHARAVLRPSRRCPAPWVDALRARVVENPGAGLAPVWRAELRASFRGWRRTATARTDADPRNLFEAVCEVLQRLAASGRDVRGSALGRRDEPAPAGVRRSPADRAPHLLVVTARDGDLSLDQLLRQILGDWARPTPGPGAPRPALARIPWRPGAWSSGPRRRMPRRSRSGARAGNPFVAVETVRALRHRGRGTPSADAPARSRSDRPASGLPSRAGGSSPSPRSSAAS